MIIKEIKDKKEWEDFVFLCEEKTFCHSWNWGEFNLTMGDDIWRFGVYDNNLLAVFQVIKIKAKRGNFLFVPHGPVFLLEEKKKEILEEVFGFLKDLGKKERVVFIRIGSLLLKDDYNDKLFKDLGFVDSPMHMHPEITWELDLSLSEEELLKNMRKTTRYLVRQAEKEIDVKIEKSKDKKDLEDFEKIYEETAKRHSFVPFSKNYLQTELDAFSKDDQVLIFSGKHKEKTLSSALIIFYSERAFYHQGASLTSKIPVSYLLQWEAIKEAKKRGCKKYNFWGIVPDTKENENHPWKGLSLFKKGFGGYEKDYIRTKDYPLSWKYWLVYIFEQLRKRKRHL
jgi:lipid II:glycine glycyltransferase (peptidoglycan interpeptide bridge formation enzyme)